MKYTITRCVSTKYEFDNDQAVQLLIYFLKELKQKECATDFLMTSGNFLLGPGVEIHISSKGLDTWHPPSSIMEQLISAGKDQVNELILEIRSSLVGMASYLTIGCDPVIINDKFEEKFVAELVYLYDVEKDVISVTGKHFPTTKQEKTLLRFEDVDSHFHKLGDTKVMILGCHDLNIFSGRSRNQLREGTNRKTASDQFIEKAIEFKPEIVLHHPHWTDTPKIWQAGWGGLKKILPTVKHYASGIYYPSGARGDLGDVLNATKNGNVMSIQVS